MRHATYRLQLHRAFGFDDAAGVVDYLARPRLVMSLAGDWADTTIELPAGRWRNCLTGDQHPGGSVELRQILDRFPVALLARSTP